MGCYDRFPKGQSPTQGLKLSLTIIFVLEGTVRQRDENNNFIGDMFTDEKFLDSLDILAKVNFNCGLDERLSKNQMHFSFLKQPEGI